MDLGTAMSYWVQRDDHPAWVAMGFAPTAATGGLTRREVAERYGERTGRDVSNMLYYYAFALLKGGVILQQIFYRYAKGFTRDPRFARLGELVRVLARMAVHSAETGKY
jgi:aminoglycoside phosphotransferase (APT) family kinase protein